MSEVQKPIKDVRQDVKIATKHIEDQAVEMVKTARKGGNFFNNLAEIQATFNQLVSTLMEISRK